ncbi:MAG: DegT/DnrJ/EryC1/StrS family aminotransferase [Bdellovibrionales bacterium]|jgi:UDP-2-acetamido-2-deoxy-ribo-hexuluronate aminotransferase|nr:DegT/DnrJ/EryC1/StrS family aminotransferase [Bdellovibrionales bacterium]
MSTQSSPVHNPIPYLDLKPQYRSMEKAIQERIHTVLEHGQFILGPEVQESETALAAFAGSKYCLTAASGTDALIMALMALGVGPGDEVITTGFSFFATAEVISLIGASPVFVDIDPVTYNLDVSKVEAAITKKTKAIMPVSLYGQPADFIELEKIAQKHGLPVVEDAAQSFGAVYNAPVGSAYHGKRSGALGTIGATSFFPAKPLGCYGDGGAVFTDDENLYKKMSIIRTHGQESRYHHVAIGINGRLDTIQCTIILEKLKRYGWEIERRQRVAEMYNKAFSDFGAKCVVPKVKSDRQSVWAQYTVLVQDRDAFAAALKAKGVPTSVHYPSPLHHQPVYKELRDKFKLPEAEKASYSCISLPLYADMPDEHIEHVIKAVREVLA